MIAPAIDAIGAFTAVGKDAPETMSSLLSVVQLFDDLATFDSNGEPITGAATPIRSRVTGVERLAALALYAIEECVASTSNTAQTFPLILAAPGPPDLSPGDANELLRRLAAESALRIDPALSRVIPRGRDAVPLALAEARKLLGSRRVSACLVAGVDSLIGSECVARLSAGRRVRDSSNPDGFTPGEAAACLILTSDRSRRPAARLAGLGLSEEPGSWSGDPPVTGKGLSQAIASALGEAGVDAATLGYIAHDVSGEHAAFEELSLALGRLPPRDSEAAKTWGPATCVGEVGAAAGFVSLAMLAFYIEKSVLTRPGLASFISEGRVRGAAVVVPSHLIG